MSREQDRVSFAPPKSLFVKMLVRDIELKDAILDLLDNCIDGVQRDLKNNPREINVEIPYEGYQAEITINPDEFIIHDNCGGIPRDTAKNNAFRIGRVDLEQDSDLDTVGMYGIGMKRAIFKMGSECDVISQNNQSAYKVGITPEWLNDEDNYQLPLDDIEKCWESDGTKVHIKKLQDNISRRFDPKKSTFTSDLKKEISQLFSVIIRKGFSVILNGEKVEPKEVTLLAPEDSFLTDQDGAIEPYLFTGEIQGVKVEVAIGFYRNIASVEEIEQEQVEKKTSERAGWSVICNDRLVLYADKTHLTGWGTAGIPNYHTQFISIAGVVTLRSSHAESLPLTTTKRGLDTNSDVYASVLDIMKRRHEAFHSFHQQVERKNRGDKQELSESSVSQN